MTDPHEVISAFLDDEPFEPEQLSRALSEPDGRALLLDLLALRQVMQPVKDATPAPHRRSSPWRSLVAAAAIVMALVGGYLVGHQRAAADNSDAPPATRIVEAGEWQVLP